MYVVNIHKQGNDTCYPPVYLSNSPQHALEAARSVMKDDNVIDSVIIHDVVCNSLYSRDSFSSENIAFTATRDADGEWQEIRGKQFMVTLLTTA